MRRRSALAQAFLLLATSGLIGCAPAADTRMPVTNAAAEVARVREVIDLFFDSAKKRDWDAAGDLMADDFEIYADEASSYDKRSYVELLKQDDMELKYMQLTDLAISVSSDGRMAWSKYRGVFKGVSRGSLFDVATVETLIFRKEEGNWKITRAHASTKSLGLSKGNAAAGE